MKLNSNLLNEVIADAKAVRETAVQTAISRLKETFEPTVRNLISQKLREEGDELEKLPAEDETEEMPAETPEDETQQMPVGEDMDDYTEETYDDIFEEDDYADGYGDENLDNGEEDEEFLAQVLGELDDYFPSQDDVETPGDVGSIYEDDGEMGGEMEKPAPSPVEEPLEGYTEEELDEMIDQLENELGQEMMAQEEEEGEEGSMNENFAWGEEEYDFQNDFGRIVTENRKLKRQLRGAQRHLKEAYKAINTQKSAINEVNLLNSKLLFLTKITSKHQLSPQKQVKILEAFDRAQTVREVKLVYATIAESLSKDAKSGLKARGINESASRPARVVKKSLNENYDFAKRWRELAGIK